MMLGTGRWLLQQNRYPVSVVKGGRNFYFSSCSRPRKVSTFYFTCSRPRKVSTFAMCSLSQIRPNVDPVSSTAESENSLAAFNLDEYFVKGCVGPAPQCPDYVGPVEIKMAGGVGRGLFVTRDVREGDLLVVGQALAMAHRGDSEEEQKASKQEIARQLMEMAVSSPWKMRQVYSLSDGHGDHEREVPSLDLVAPAPPQGQSLRAQPIDFVRICRIVQANVFHVQNPSWRTCWSRGDAPSSVLGIFLLPSFINHSCAPNASWKVLGKAMFIQACRDLKSGEEVTISYFDTFQPEQQRGDICMSRGFTCHCPRCTLERTVESQSSTAYDLKYQFGVYLQSLSEMQTGPVNAQGQARRRLAEVSAKICESVERVVESPELKLDWETRNWLRSSYCKLYVMLLFNAFETRNNELAAKSLDTVLEMVLASHPGVEIGLQLSCVPWLMKNTNFPEHKIKEWHDLSLLLVKCIYGDLKLSTKEAIVKAYKGSARF